MATPESPASSTALRDETVLRRVRQLGTAHSGLKEWRLQRLTAIALVPLGLYLVANLLRLAVSEPSAAAAWLSSPVGAALVLIFLAAAIAHAVVGLRSVFADYVHGRGSLLAAQLVTSGVAIVLGVAGGLAVLKLFLGR